MCRHQGAATLPRRRLEGVEDISVVSGRPAQVSRPEGSARVLLTFRGLREAPHIRDKDTRVRVSVPVSEASRLWRLLGERLTDVERAEHF